MQMLLKLILNASYDNIGNAINIDRQFFI